VTPLKDLNWFHLSFHSLSGESPETKVIQTVNDVAQTIRLMCNYEAGTRSPVIHCSIIWCMYVCNLMCYIKLRSALGKKFATVLIKNFHFIICPHPDYTLTCHTCFGGQHCVIHCQQWKVTNSTETLRKPFHKIRENILE
jgi:hypothetical protein